MSSAPNSRPALQPVPESMPIAAWSSWLIQLARTVNALLGGKRNSTTTVTLAAGATTTTLTDSRIGYFSVLTLMPTTANAAGDLAGLYITAGDGSAVITHANTADVDKTFGVVIES